MAKRSKTLSYAFRGNPETLRKLQGLINKALESAVPKIDPSGPIENWGQNGGWVQDIKDGWAQSGGWYLVVENKKAIKASRPEKSVVKITETVYQALSKAKQRG